jgi:hypothetical protein
MGTFKIMRDRGNFYIGLGDTWMGNPEFGDRPLLTISCINPHEWSSECDSLIAELKRIKSRGLGLITKMNEEWKITRRLPIRSNVQILKRRPMRMIRIEGNVDIRKKEIIEDI